MLVETRNTPYNQTIVTNCARIFPCGRSPITMSSLKQITFFLLFLLFAYWSSRVYQKYLYDPTYTSFKEVIQQKVDFPSITICPVRNEKNSKTLEVRRNSPFHEIIVITVFRCMGFLTIAIQLAKLTIVQLGLVMTVKLAKGSCSKW